MRAPVDCEPCDGLLPDQAPDAVQEVAFVDPQARVALLCLPTELRLAAKVTVGAG